MEDFINSMVSSIYGSDFVEFAENVIRTPPDMFDGLVTALSEAVTPIASVLVCIYFIMALMDKLSSDNFTGEQFVKLLIKLVFSIAVIDNITDLSLMIMEFGTTFMNMMTGSLGSFATVDAEELTSEMGLIQQMGTFVVLLLPWIASFLLRLAMYVLAYGRTLEIGLRAALAPIGCADLITGGTNSSGFRYIKRMIGISLQGAIMLAVISCAGTLCNYTLDSTAGITDLTFIVQYFGIMAAMVGTMAASKSLAFEIVGA